MTTYADLQATPQYKGKIAGAAVAIALYDIDNNNSLLGASTTGINCRQDMEQVPVEEAGEDGTNEIVTGRHSISWTINGFFSPERGDLLPTRQNFLGSGAGREYTIIETIAEGRQGAGAILSVIVGAKINSMSDAHGARGVKTFDIAGVALRKYSGAEYALAFGA